MRFAGNKKNIPVIVSFHFQEIGLENMVKEETSLKRVLIAHAPSPIGSCFFPPEPVVCMFF